MAYRTAKYDPRSPLVPTEVEGAGVAGTLQCAIRPSPVVQPPMAEVKLRVSPTAHAAERALVIGGSRGLGEATAKILAAGGGQVVVTYRSGRADAEAVVSEIALAGGQASALPLDVLAPDASMLRGSGPFTHCYYFASPPIRKGKLGAMDSQLHDEFRRYYVTALERLAPVLDTTSAGALVVFYPSTVFLDRPEAGFAEYVAAKKDGEETCRRLAELYPRQVYYAPRLPRARTDQTASLIPISTEDPIDVMIAELDRMRDRVTVSGNGPGQRPNRKS